MRKKHVLSCVILFIFLFLISINAAGAANTAPTGSGTESGYAVNFAKSQHITKELLDSMGLGRINKVMIVAHPDDEILWGGMHLMKDDYLVVCLTNAETKEYGSRRAEEFRTVMEKTKDKAIIMYYPDLTDGKRDDWSLCSSEIAKDLSILLQYKKWKLVVTHGVKGEYGHIHHKMTSRLVKNAFKSSKLRKCTLKGFGKYYSVKAKLPRVKYKKRQIEAKQSVLDLYESQNTTMFTHMIGYENWTTLAKKR